MPLTSVTFAVNGRGAGPNETTCKDTYPVLSGGVVVKFLTGSMCRVVRLLDIAADADPTPTKNTTKSINANILLFIVSPAS